MKRASGIGIAGGSVNPWSPVATLVVVDIDNPDLLAEGSSLKSLVETTVSWYTGPRCPRCGEKHLEAVEPGVRFKCPSCGVEFTASEARSGVVAVFTVSLDVAEKYFKSTTRARGVEFLVNNYALIPPSIHPSGVRYEWTKPFDFEAALDKDEIVEIIKASVEGLMARGKFHRGTYTDIPALAPLVFTSNKYIPRADALLRRLKVLCFTYGERVPGDRAREFESKVKPELRKLKAIGDYIASYFLKNGLGEDIEKQGVEALETAYKSVGLEPPDWLKLEAEASSETEIYEDLRERVRVFLVKRINEEYNRFVGRITVEKPEEGVEVISRQEADLKTRIEIVLDKQLIPWLFRKDNDVLITTGIMQELEEVIGDIGGLKSLAELLGWEYIPKKKLGKSVVSVASVGKRDLIDFLSAIEEPSGESS